ncbi:MAG: CRISPR-associated endonuclease Cas2 [Nitrospirae bacterium]|nr:CRISPR-associated endonuclease Cas2 [Nitrospirota bacterium]
MRAAYLVCYDIADPRRLNRVLRLMKGKGLHLQYSIFHCSLTWPQLMQLKEELKDLIEEQEDDVRIYPLPSGGKIIALGCGDRVPEGVEIFIQ